MFSKLPVVVMTSIFISLAAATPTTKPPVIPPTSDQCCKSVVSSTSAAASAVAALVGLDLDGLDIPVGLSCSPITVAGNNCGNTAVTCDAPEDEWDGLIAINCIPISARRALHFGDSNSLRWYRPAVRETKARDLACLKKIHHGALRGCLYLLFRCLKYVKTRQLSTGTRIVPLLLPPPLSLLRRPSEPLRSIMFSSMKFSVGLLVFSGVAAAISNLQVLGPVTTGGPIRLTWSSESTDPGSVSVVLFSGQPAYAGGYAIANNINSQANQATVPLPDVPVGSFTLALTQLYDTSEVLDSTGEFSIGAPGYQTATTKGTTVTSSHVWLSTQSTKPTSVTRSAASGSSTHSGSSSVGHSASYIPVASASSSIIASMTVPFPSASSHPIESFTSAETSLSATTSGAHATTVPSPSPSAHKGEALTARVPALGLAIAMSGVLVGAWAV
ncbi:hypothetical protein K438DRAFT_1754122 [Mycena galopus ATCC 62051]|nr:hypothetical protein K438DRAFT_1754122 [Mycena galopus ATCC 62051]